MSTVIDTPGVYDMPFDDYLRDPVPGGSLSNSGAKTLLNAPPAVYAYEREHGRPDTLSFDVGHAAHHAVLGDGMPIAVIPDGLLGSNGATSTNAAKRFIADARARGAVPIKSDVAAEVDAMATALREHPIAGKILEPGGGEVEQSAFWIDEASGVWLRARYDYMRRGDRLTITDYKTADRLDDRGLANTIAKYGYATQHAWYCDGAKALRLDDDPRFLLIFQSKTAPYLARVIELPERWVQFGRDDKARAIDIYKRCSDSGDWPGYPMEIETLDPPIWVELEREQEITV